MSVFHMMLTNVKAARDLARKHGATEMAKAQDTKLQWILDHSRRYVDVQGR